MLRVHVEDSKRLVRPGGLVVGELIGPAADACQTLGSLQRGFARLQSADEGVLFGIDPGELDVRHAEGGENVGELGVEAHDRVDPRAAVARHPVQRGQVCLFVEAVSPSLVAEE